MMKAIISLIKPKITRPMSLIRSMGLMFQYLYRIAVYRSFNINLNSKEFWDKKLAGKGDFWRDIHYHELLEVLPKDKPFTLMDLGCALGDGPRFLKKHFASSDITGVDISPAAIEKAKAKRDDIKYAVFDILKDEIPRRYDYITVIETLEHFDDPFYIVEKCLKMCDRALIISTPYTPSYTGKIRFVDEHRYSFNEKTFERYGAQVVKITEFMKETGSQCILYKIAPPNN